jgi:hypothetical protein
MSKEKMRKAIESHRQGKKQFQPGPKHDKQFKRPGRSAAARDARHKTRGRLPIGFQIFILPWDGKAWTITGAITGKLGEDKPAWSKTIVADGLFRALEELDMAFWEWKVTLSEEEQKKFVFPPIRV